MSQKGGCLGADVSMYWGHRSFEGSVLEDRASMVFGLPCLLGSMAVEDFVGSAEDEFVGVGTVNEGGTHAKDLADALELNSAELVGKGVGERDGLKAVD